MHARQLLAVRTPEKGFWLARAIGQAFEAEEDMLHSGNEIERGWLLVNVRWYDKRPGYYVLCDAQVPLIVNTIIRIGGLCWARTEDGKYYIDADTVERIESSI